ncbi:hypothetical protein NGI13_05480 [Enterobacter asburiae]|uniref:hypothetical protein n=1 Tax=Enterobacter asburiae TaxID=61645 RepID=UPI002DB702FD|nr:hypothetical protein [Enterobacter asburiae]MEB8255019.1 hypothetical protein [Enterobacter asburiae]
MSEKPLAYVEDDGDLVVIDVHDSKVHVPLARIETPEHVVKQIWRLSTKNNYEGEALKQAIEIMSKKIGIMNTAGDWTFVGNA